MYNIPKQKPVAHLLISILFVYTFTEQPNAFAYKIYLNFSACQSENPTYVITLQVTIWRLPFCLYFSHKIVEVAFDSRSRRTGRFGNGRKTG